MAGMLELLYLDFKTMINGIEDLMDKVGNMEEQIDNVSREMEILTIRNVRNKKKR